jgi:hypothetical protein
LFFVSLLRINAPKAPAFRSFIGDKFITCELIFSNG